MIICSTVSEFLHTHGQSDTGKIVTATNSEDIMYVCVCVFVCVSVSVSVYVCVRTHFCVRHSAGLTEENLLYQVEKAIRGEVHEQRVVLV
jgi:hypothetical protein